jgi:hypothetical protein
MEITLHLTPEIESKLKTEAAATGKAPEAVVLEAIEDRLANGNEASSMLPYDEWKAKFDEMLATMPRGKIHAGTTLPPNEWLQEFDAWVSDHESRNPRLDDSRESIYPDR